VFGKLFTKSINYRSNKWAENYYVNVESQAGFRSKMGTVDNVFFVLNALINHFLTENKLIFVCVVDFTKAFDYLGRENIIYKLIQYGIRGKISNIIKSLYGNIKSRVKYNNTLSEAFECHLGVFQGDSLSLLIFS